MQPSDPTQKPVCILGGNDVVEAQLLTLNVTHVLSIVSRKRRQHVAAKDSEGFERLALDLEDDIEADLLGALPHALDFMGKAAASGGLCYVHCEQGRSRSAAVVIAWLMQERKEHGLLPSLLESFAAVASRRRISALNYGFFATLCDFEASLGTHPSSLPLLSFFMLQFLGSGGIWNFRPPADFSELKQEYGRKSEEADEFGCPPVPRIRCLRKMLNGFDYVLKCRRNSSLACRKTLLEFQL